MLLLNLEKLENYALTTITLKHKRNVIRLAMLLMRRIVIAYARRSAERKSKRQTIVLCVYPDLSKPTFVAEYNSLAYHYLTDQMLPNASGLFKRGIMRLTSIHPSLDTFVLVDKDRYTFEKNQYFQTLFTSSELNELSMLEIKTSNPLALSFTKNKVPSYVVRLGDENDIELHQRKIELYKRGLTCIPEPVATLSRAEHTLIYERAIQGESWFTVLEKIDLQTVRTLSILGLLNFNNQIQTVCEPLTINIRAVAMNVAKSVISRNVVLLTEANQQLLATKLLNSIKSLNEANVTVYPTHGDFCVNNLIFDGDSVNVVDLEDFDKFKFPFFDELALAVSLALLSAEHTSTSFTLQSVKNEFDNIIDICSKADEKQVSFDALLSYFILTRLDQWGDNAARKPYLECLVELIR